LDVDSIALAGPAGGDPLFQPVDPADYRWPRGSVVDALWAEWYRALAEAALPPRHSLPRALWRWQVDLPRVANPMAGLPGRGRRATPRWLGRARERVRSAT
jgi:hypothetical protein